MTRVHAAKTILWMITGLGIAVAVTRFMFGLGATTNLNDTTPWGLWIGFDVMGGVALAAGGFVTTALFYVMRREEFHPLVRPAVLTAFLGYIAVILSLLVDLGLPWNIWHLMIYWNPRSPLFEVGWCVMLYTAVLLLEFSPVPLEQTDRWARIRSALMKLRFPLVLAGIMLSTLHQSSLGSLFLIMPFKSHLLWYTNILPVLFFISAVGLGLMMVSFENLASAWLYGRRPETHLVAILCSAVRWVLLLYLAVRLADIFFKGKISLIYSGTWESDLFILELMIMAVLPTILFTIRRIRDSLAGQWIGSFLVVIGTIFNRINVGGLTMIGSTGDFYFPSWMEIVITAAIISFMVLVFLFALERFRIWEECPRDPEAEPYARPAFSRGGETWLGNPGIAARTKYSLVFVVSIAAGLAFMPTQKMQGKGIKIVPVSKARGGDTLFIDGNRDNYGVYFTHELCLGTPEDKSSCARCHHMNLPSDQHSGCFECHSNMYTEGEAFDHERHISRAGTKITCDSCHERDLARTAESTRECDACHKDLVPENATIKVDNYHAPSYTDAMHGVCIECHAAKAKEVPSKENLAICSACHTTSSPDHLQPEMREILTGPYYNHVVLPGFKPDGGSGRVEENTL